MHTLPCTPTLVYPQTYHRHSYMKSEEKKKSGRRDEGEGEEGRRELFSNNLVSPPETVGVTDERPLSIEVKTTESCTQIKQKPI